jgi:deoxyribonuclease IV
MIIGSHVSLSSPDYFLGSVKETLYYNANALMIYTGAPQNTFRKNTSELKIEEAKQLLQEANIPAHHIIVHAPYIINLANTSKT